MFNNAGSINFRGKKVKQIIRIKDNAILYQMEDNHIEFTFTKNVLRLHSFSGSNMIIDYGNGDIRQTTGELVEYNYNTLEDETHIVKIYGVTGIGNECFSQCYGLTDITIPSTVTSIGARCFTDCDNLTNVNLPSSIQILPTSCFHFCVGLLSIDIPSSITSIGGGCFYGCSQLVEINLNWTTLEDIVSYSSNWITGANANLKFIIPEGTTDLYIEKGYPSDKLVENSINVDVDNPILSYADSTQENPQTATLTATINPIESGKTVQIFKNDVLVATEQTDSQGQVSYEYISQGFGDVEFEFKCNLVIKTFVIHDYYYYDSLTVDKQRYTTINGSPSLSYSSNGLNINTSATSVALVRNNFLTLPSSYEAELTITEQINYGGGICFDDTLWDISSPKNSSIYKLSNTSLLVSNLNKFNTGDIVKIKKQDSTFTYYINDVQIWTGTITGDTHYQQFRTYQNRGATYKDLKIRQL